MIGLLLGTVVGFSDRSATTDQDIARLLLTPAGAFAVLAAITLSIAAAALDVTLPFPNADTSPETGHC
jgi:glycerophosphoryl diester phosphodiesterase